MRYIFICLMLIFQQIYAESHDKLFQCKVRDASDETALVNLYEKFINEKAFSAQYVQTNYVKALSKELVSGGNFMFIPDKGIVWETVYPYKQNLFITKEGEVLEKDNKNPVGVFSYAKIMNEMIDSGLDKLSRVFEIFFLEKKSKWYLGLIPEKRAMSKFIKNIVINGDHSGKISKVIVTGHDNVKITEIEFKNHKHIKTEDLNGINEIFNKK